MTRPYNRTTSQWDSYGRMIPVTFEEACRRFPNRFTLEHIPDWYRLNPWAPNGRCYAPQYFTDREWFNKTIFPAERLNEAVLGTTAFCRSLNHTYPLGVWLDEPYGGQQEIEHYAR